MTPAESAAFSAKAHRYAAEVFRNSPHEAQRNFAPVIDTWADNAEARSRLGPEQADLFEGLTRSREFSPTAEAALERRTP